MADSHDEWYTQTADYNRWCAEYQIYPMLDVSAAKTHKMCEYAFYKEDDLLKQQFTMDFWMNPPLLGRMTQKSVLHAYNQAFKNKVNGLCLIPAGVIARQWFRPIWKRFVQNIRDGEDKIFIDPIDRPSFHDHGEAIGQQARNDYIMLVLRGRLT